MASRSRFMSMAQNGADAVTVGLLNFDVSSLQMTLGL
jgi:hypothetical protein